MKISVIGSGYVGTTQAACLAELGHDVVAIDIDQAKVDAINAGSVTLHEPGLADLVATHVENGRLRATTEYDAVRETDLTFVCVQTPSADDGGQDLSAYRAVAESLASTLAAKEEFHVVTTKSTVLPGTVEDVLGEVLTAEGDLSIGDDVGLAMNPEFLREGSAVADFQDPDKVVIGASDERTRSVLHDCYAELLDKADPVVIDTEIRAAELIKYANNAFLASKVSLVNDLGNICKELDIDAYDVLEAVGVDHRISEEFMRSGLGWGGSCFPKDVDAIRELAREHDYEPPVLDGAVEVNDLQPRRMVELLAEHVDIADSRIAVLGLAFKPGTDDVRNSRALDVITELLARDASVVATDPHAIENTEAIFPTIDYAEGVDTALDCADAAMVCTDWPAFQDGDWSRMNRSVVIDGRRIDIDRDALDIYEGLCW